MMRRVYVSVMFGQSLRTETDEEIADYIFKNVPVMLKKYKRYDVRVAIWWCR